MDHDWYGSTRVARDSNTYTVSYILLAKLDVKLCGTRNNIMASELFINPKCSFCLFFLKKQQHRNNHAAENEVSMQSSGHLTWCSTCRGNYKGEKGEKDNGCDSLSGAVKVEIYNLLLFCKPQCFKKTRFFLSLFFPWYQWNERGYLKIKPVLQELWKSKPAHLPR